MDLNDKLVCLSSKVFVNHMGVNFLALLNILFIIKVMKVKKIIVSSDLFVLPLADDLP